MAKASELAADNLGIESVKLLATTYAKLVEGQTREIELSFRTDYGVEGYMEIVEGKTASLIRTSARLGAIASGCDSSTINAISEWGLQSGIAFQISDDILDLTSDQEKLGKPVGNDILEGTYTLPVHIAIEEYGSPFLDIVRETKEDKGRINHLLEVLKSEKILNKTREMTKYHLSESNKALNTLKGFPIYKTLLKINEYLLKRTY